MRSVELLAACDQGDEARMEQLGWRPVLDALRYWPKKLTGNTLAPYCSLLGDEDIDEVVTAIRAFPATASQWRPSPVEVFQRIHPPVAAPAQQRPAAGISSRPDNTPEAYEAVLDWVAMGEDVCDCLPRSPQCTIDAAGVLRCSECGRLEPGQYDQAIEWRETQA